MRFAITGSSGLIGSALVASLRKSGHDVVRLVRRSAARGDEIAWDPAAERGGLAPAAVDSLDVVINLAGAGVASRRWTSSYQAELRASRIRGTNGLVAALTAAGNPPSVLLSGSAIGFYGDTGGREVDESAPPGTGFLPGLARDWEAAAQPAADAGIRVITLRTGLVLSPRGGMLARLLPPFRLGLGARLGPGTQVMSWISLREYTRIVEFLLTRDDVTGPVNMTAPGPVSNAEFTAALAAAVHRPAKLSVPGPVLRTALGGVSGDLLASARVVPRALLTAGYEFRYPELPAALAAELRPASPAPAEQH
ncbi:MAG: TIGR01777 family oxidoreductase [Actinobacteria bacterium]|nr:TIGR01777 family oxidoreductase [Actinomycetota bacterium]MBO0817898.1 TIGR01777 family oxidoreductase [Actinomycetota bacterium]